MNPNLLINTDFSQTYQQTTGWDTAKNGTTLASSWGGYNSGVTNASTVYHAHLAMFHGEQVYEYIKTDNEAWLGVSQGGLLRSLFELNKTYTFSVDIYRTGNNYLNGGFYSIKQGETNYNWHIGQFSSSNVEKNKWVRFTYTFTVPSNIDLSKNVYWYMYGMNGGNGTMYMKRPKIEVGSVATPWCLSDSEGYTETQHGIVEYPSESPSRVYTNIVKAKDFIEW